MTTQEFNFEDKIARIALLLGFLSLGIGGIFGITQLMARTPYAPKFIDSSTYYTILTGHGVLMALIWTTFFIVAFSNYVMTRELRIRLSRNLLGGGVLLALLGTVIAAIAIFTGNAAVLYTFYPPMTAHPAFYIGAAMLIIGTWLIAFAYFKAYLDWRKSNPGMETPIGSMGILATWIVWLEATPPLAFMVLKNLVPMSLLGTSVDVIESRLYFWFFGHPLVYFWLIPAVTFWYFVLPKITGVEVFSKKMSKVAYILFILVSTPVGVHHQFVDPGITNFAKFIHTLFTFAVATPSLLTGFNVLATLERAGRKRGGKGLLGWLRPLPWNNPAFAAAVLSFILFGFGGMSGVINASFVLNYVVHNTTWIVGHFHLTVGSAATLTFIAASYLLVPTLFGKEVLFKRLNTAQPYLWFIGMAIFSFSLHVVGVLGVPRRTFDVSYGGAAPSVWAPLLLAALVGGIIFATSGAIFVISMLTTILRGTTIAPEKASEIKQLFAGYTLGAMGRLDNLKIWITIALILIAFAYSIPFYDLYTRGLSPSPPVTPEGLKLG
ncbi:MAG: cbb3-type cytochrome c oxidase subunit I [Desulfurococcales archaeon]|nr:cbb3-type cytochrome c oxidase subunit I [Desulfurococcales archaeon]